MIDENEFPVVGARACDMGSPREYTEHMYEVYFEVGEHENMALRTFEEYLGPDRLGFITPMDHGYLLKVPLQAVPDLVISLSEKNIAVYQVVRFARSKEVWR
ncbi:MULTISPECIES: hypothetical protein [Pseudoalteromonas]|nr:MULTISPECIES: hypothetical protein [Pseudoalteromonas]